MQEMKTETNATVPVVDWSGSCWIGDGEPLPAQDEWFYADDPAPQFRRTFAVKGEMASATLHIAGLGYYEARINGRPLADSALHPLWTPYGKRILFDTYDVTRAISARANTITVTLGNGWYHPLPLRMWGHLNIRKALCVGRPCLRARLEIVYADGSTDTVSTDETWRFTDRGPLLRNSIYLGEVYDARREIDGWMAPDYDDSGWQVARCVDGPPGRLQPRGSAPAIGVRDTWIAKAVSSPSPGVHVVDLGVNFAGHVRVKLGQGAAGNRIAFRYGELLHDDGTVNVKTGACGQIKAGRCGGGPGSPPTAEQCDVYIRRGGAAESYAPRFTWHAFRYVQIEGLEQAPDVKDIEAVAVASRLAVASTFECSDARLNELFAVCRNTFLSNVFGVQSDCPGRERLGYGGDIAVTSEAFIHNFDMRGFHAKTLQDFADEAEDDGWFTETAPYVGIADRGFGGRSGPIGWTVAVPILMRDLYRYYGDVDVVRRHYRACTRYIDLLHARCPDHIIPDCLGDHEALDRIEGELPATAHYYQWVSLVARFAQILGESDDALTYGERAERIRRAFQQRFVNDGKVGEGRQAEQLFGLYHRLIPEKERGRAVDLLVADIKRRGNALSTGIFGTQYLFDVCREEGMSELAGRLVTRRAFPGWMHMLDNGATSLWETWAMSDDTFSQSHPMFGSVSSWMIADLLGITPEADAVGFDRIRINPQAVARLTWARGSYRCPRGTVAVQWCLAEGRMLVSVDVPEGMQARLWRPDRQAWQELASGTNRVEYTTGC